MIQNDGARLINRREDMIILLNTNELIGIITGSVMGTLILGVLIFVLVKFVFIRKSINRQIRELERKCSYLDALLIGQDSQYIKRLEIISRTNLLYGDIYNDFSKRFKKVYEVDDKFADGAMKQLNALVASKQYKNIKKVIQEAKKAVSIFETNTLELDIELTKLIKPEEEARQIILKLKEDFRSIKQVYYANSVDLELASNSFETVFEKVDKKFSEHEAHVESAEYEEAASIVPVISNVLKVLHEALDVMPKMCVLVSSVLPEKIKNLVDEEEVMLDQKYPLHHLMVSQEVNSFNYDLSVMKKKLIELDTSGIFETSDKIQKEIETIKEKFIKEKEAKEFFVSNCDSTYQKVLNLEKVFLRICAIIPEMNKYYLISSDKKEEIEDLKKKVNDLGGAKRSLDTYIHSSTKQPYTLLKEKLEKLMEDYEIVLDGVNSFKTFLDVLKTSSEEAYTLVFSYYYRLKQCEAEIRKINLPEHTDKYMDKISTCYELLNDIDRYTKTIPIDVKTINEKVDELKELADSVIDEVAKEVSVAELAESAIVYANRDRIHQTDVHQQLNLCEKEFYQGDFDRAYHDVIELLKSQHVDESNDGNN
jgi:septation ring formation regulator EzrA